MAPGTCLSASPPLLEFIWGALRPTYPTMSPPESRCRGSSADRSPTRRRVPLSWFFTTPAVCSIGRALGVLHPSARQGSHRFSCDAGTANRPEGQSCVVHSRAFPMRRSHPSKKSPLLQPFRVSATVAFLVLRLSMSRAETRLAERPSPSRRCSATGSVVPKRCFQHPSTLSFHGLGSPPGP